MPVVQQYTQQIAPTPHSSVVPESAELISLKSNKPVIDLAKGVSDIALEASNKMREADHVANYAYITNKAENMINERLIKYKTDPLNFDKHSKDYTDFQKDITGLTDKITDPASRNNISVSLDKIYNQGQRNVNVLTVEQRIGNSKMKLNDSLESAKRAGDTAKFNVLLDEGYKTALYSPEEYARIKTAGTRESEINRATGFILSDPTNAKAVIADPSLQLDPGDKLSLLRLGNQIIADEYQTTKLEQARQSEEVERELSNYILNDDVVGGKQYLRANKAKLTPEDIQRYENLFESDIAMDYNYYNDLWNRTLQGNNTIKEIMQTSRIPAKDKSSLITAYNSVRGGAGGGGGEGGLMSSKQVLTKRLGFATDILEAAIVTTGPLAQFKTDEQMTLAQAKISAFQAAQNGQDPVDWANNFTSKHLAKSKKLKTKYGSITNKADYDVTGRKAVQDYKAGRISRDEFNDISEVLQMSKNVLGL